MAIPLVSLHGTSSMHTFHIKIMQQILQIMCWDCPQSQPAMFSVHWDSFVSISIFIGNKISHEHFNPAKFNANNTLPLDLFSCLVCPHAHTSRTMPIYCNFDIRRLEIQKDMASTHEMVVSFWFCNSLQSINGITTTSFSLTNHSIGVRLFLFIGTTS